MMLTIFEGPRQCGKSTHLMTCVADRLERNISCWVYCYNRGQIEHLKDLLKKKSRLSITRNVKAPTSMMEFSNETTVRFAVLNGNHEHDLHSMHTNASSLFINDGDYKPDETDGVIGYPIGWHEVFMTRTTGPDAPPQRTVH